jgi:hypothetical protein
MDAVPRAAPILMESYRYVMAHYIPETVAPYFYSSLLFLALAALAVLKLQASGLLKASTAVLGAIAALAYWGAAIGLIFLHEAAQPDLRKAVEAHAGCFPNKTKAPAIARAFESSAAWAELCLPFVAMPLPFFLVGSRPSVPCGARYREE